MPIFDKINVNLVQEQKVEKNDREEQESIIVLLREKLIYLDMIIKINLKQ